MVGRTVPHAVLQAEAAKPQPWGPFNGDPRILGEVPLGGELHFRLDPEWITLGQSWVATPKTYVNFEGRTAYGERSRIPFHVTSLDWLVSTSLVPISFALTGPVAAAIGAEATLAGAGVIACAATLLCLLIPGMRDTERDDRLGVLAEEAR